MKEHDVVILKEDIYEVPKGQIGTIIHVYQDKKYEVEFGTDFGSVVALVSENQIEINTTDLNKLDWDSSIEEVDDGLVCVLCGEPWKPFFKNRCECGGFCTWGKEKGGAPSSWNVTEKGWIPKPPPSEIVLCPKCKTTVYVDKEEKICPNCKEIIIKI